MNVTLVQFSSSFDGSTHGARLVAEALRADGCRVATVFAHEGPAVSSFAGAGFDVRILGHKNWLRSKSWIRTARNVAVEMRGIRGFRDLFANLETDLVYVNTGASFAAAWAAKQERYPMVWHLRELHSVHGGELVSPKWLRAAVSRVMMACRPHWIVSGRAVADDLIRGADRVHIVRNCIPRAFGGVMPQPGEARRALGVPAEGFLLVLPGTIRPVKGVLEFLIAAIPALNEDPKLQVAITGNLESSYGHRVLDVVQSSAVSDRVHFLGKQVDMLPVYAAADGVIVASHSETFGRVAVEALACGRPVLARPVGGLPEVLAGQKMASLCDVHDPAALRGGLEWLRSQADQTELDRLDVRRRVIQQFGEPAHAEAVAKVVRRAAREAL